MKTFKRILFARDFSSCSRYAMPYALALAKKFGAELHFVYAETLHGEPFVNAENAAQATERARERLSSLEEYVSEEELPDEIEHVVVRDVAAAPAIVTYAEDHEMDLIVMGTHGRRGMQNLLLGSVAREVVRSAHCAVLTIRERERPTKPPYGFERLLVPFDFSGHARQTLQHARELASLYGAEVDILHIIEDTLHPAFYSWSVSSIYDAHPDIEEKAAERLRTMNAELDAPDVPVHVTVRPGRPDRVIAEFAGERGSDLIMMSTRGLSGLERFLLGSTTERVLRNAPAPVLTLGMTSSEPAVQTPADASSATS